MNKTKEWLAYLSHSVYCAFTKLVWEVVPLDKPDTVFALSCK